MDSLPILAVTLLIWVGETWYKHQRADSLADFRLPSCTKALQRCAPELVGLMALAVLALLLCQRDGYVRTITDPKTLEEYLTIAKDWPLLKISDSCLALQAMMRLLLLVSALIRPDVSGAAARASPVVGEPALFMMAACAVRVGLLIASPAYILEGPLGSTNFAFELAAFPIALWLSKGAPRSVRHLIGLAVLALGIAHVAVENHIPLSGNNLYDAFFVSAWLLEMLAAAACVCRTALVCGGVQCPFAGLAHVLLPLQQGCMLYFIVHSWDTSLDDLSVGHPVKILTFASAMGTGLYLLAAVIHFFVSRDVPAAPAAPAERRFGADSTANQVF